jgi:serine/threonine protein kinase
MDPPTVSGYEIVRPLVNGGMGKIYLARQHALNRLVCMKFLSISEGEDADLCRSRFCREAEILASVSHPHILSIFDFGTTKDSGLPYLVTEYVEGGDLRQRMSVGQALPVSQAKAIILQVAEALTFLHSKGILHRDLKPENILIPADSLVKVGDFGIAVPQGDAGVLTGSLRGLGTVGYVSPEQQYGLKVDERTDQYSLAALAYELLTGRRPLGVFPPPSQLNRHLPREIDAVILRGLAEEPKNRFKSVRDFATALEHGFDASPRRAGSLSWTIAGLAALLVLLAGLAWTLRPQRAVGVPVKSARPDPIPRPAAQDAARPREVAKLNNPTVKAPERSLEFTRLVQLRAYTIWARHGRLTGKAGEAVKEKNWLEAERQVLTEVRGRAYVIWRKQGCPTGPQGEAVREKNMRTAESEILAETESDLRRHPLD